MIYFHVAASLPPEYDDNLPRSDRGWIDSESEQWRHRCLIFEKQAYTGELYRRQGTSLRIGTALYPWRPEASKGGTVRNVVIIEGVSRQIEINHETARAMHMEIRVSLASPTRSENCRTRNLND